jgi:hypothetical protein
MRGKIRKKGGEGDTFSILSTLSLLLLYNKIKKREEKKRNEREEKRRDKEEGEKRDGGEKGKGRGTIPLFYSSLHPLFSHSLPVNKFLNKEKKREKKKRKREKREKRERTEDKREKKHTFLLLLLSFLFFFPPLLGGIEKRGVCIC